MPMAGFPGPRPGSANIMQRGSTTPRFPCPALQVPERLALSDTLCTQQTLPIESSALDAAISTSLVFLAWRGPENPMVRGAS